MTTGALAALVQAIEVLEIFDDDIPGPGPVPGGDSFPGSSDFPGSDDFSSMSDIQGNADLDDFFVLTDAGQIKDAETRPDNFCPGPPPPATRS